MPLLDKHIKVVYNNDNQSTHVCGGEKMPKVSIISGAYNLSACYSFDKSISSILEQTFSDFEFIICDDGSQDNTYELLCAYAEKDARIKLIRNESNMGLAASLNRCIAEAKGEYIARHDCDDYAAPDRLEKQVEYLDSHSEISVLGTNAYLFDENGVWGEMHFPVEISKKDFLFCSPHQHGSVVFRKEVLEKANGYRVAKETRRTEDYDLFMRIHLFAKSANLPELLYYFCEDKNTLARRKYRYRIDEAKVRYKGFKQLGLLPGGFFYVIKPLIVGLIPARLLVWLKNKFLKRKKQQTNKEKDKL